MPFCAHSESKPRQVRYMVEEMELGLTEEELRDLAEIQKTREEQERSGLLVLEELPPEAEPPAAIASVYAEMTDEQIVEKCQQGDSRAVEYLLNRYKNFVRARARSYFLIGADHEDIVQEGMIGLFKAIRDYKPDRQSSFHAFAELCVTRQIITAIKTATRQKHIPLNSYVSLNKPLYDDESDRTLLDVIMEGRVTNPEELIISQEGYNSISKRLYESLSELEMGALHDFLEGKSYQEIAEHLGSHAKAIDNALQRVRKKLEKFIAESEREPT